MYHPSGSKYVATTAEEDSGEIGDFLCFPCEMGIPTGMLQLPLTIPGVEFLLHPDFMYCPYFLANQVINDDWKWRKKSTGEFILIRNGCQPIRTLKNRRSKNFVVEYRIMDVFTSDRDKKAAKKAISYGRNILYHCNPVLISHYFRNHLHLDNVFVNCLPNHIRN
jgi:hypothetical protein